ncbi:cupin domain-containing protein [Saccharomonospora sp. NPDC046836]|uniref:cupin domain-containing protein n=1 Tax=Saccharomonospora sp. NPDC046836 TaxID=3156921 RepID=UPI0033D16C9A
MSIYVSGDSVPDAVAAVGDSTLRTRAVYGNSSSLMIATRPAGYHSEPHTHACEQLNWLKDGELWIFIGDRAFQLKAGDFLRIPAGEVHWAWNKSELPCTVVEVHTPGMQHDPTISGFAVGLHDNGETPDFLGSPVNEFLPPDSGFDPGIAEQKAV